MRRFIIAAAVAGLASFAQAQSKAPAYKTLKLSDKFFSEGAHAADFNKDGNLDVVAGPYWYEGPDFTKKHELRSPKPFDPNGYSDNFLTYTGDFNGDGWADVFEMPFPAKEGYWFENPAGKEGPWKKHFAFKSVENESPMLGDITGDGRPEIVFNANKCLGYAAYDPQKPTEPWTFVALTPEGSYHKFTHGVGFGDINGDGLNDLLEAEAWWEQPKNWKPGQLWIKHLQKFADAACQMHTYDIDGDGLNDIVTAWHCHLYGMVWWKQIKSASGEITWQKNTIVSSKKEENAPEYTVSQLHALEIVDMNGDGLKDLLTGKRFWSHGPKGDVDPDAPAIVMWMELRRDGGNVKFIPHVIHNDSGVGTQVSYADLNKDGIPDVIVGNKKGSFVHLSQKP